MCPQGGVTSSLAFDCTYAPVLLEGGRVRANMLRMSVNSQSRDALGRQTEPFVIVTFHPLTDVLLPTGI